MSVGAGLSALIDPDLLAYHSTSLYYAIDEFVIATLFLYVLLCVSVIFCFVLMDVSWFVLLVVVVVVGGRTTQNIITRIFRVR